MLLFFSWVDLPAPHDDEDDYVDDKRAVLKGKCEDKYANDIKIVVFMGLNEK